MKRLVALSISLMAIFVLLTIALAQQQVKKEEAKPTSGMNIMLTPNDLKWTDPASLPPGAKLVVLEGDPNAPGQFSMRIKLPANYKIPAHWHPADEHVTVLSGTFNMGMGDKLDEKTSKELPVGSFVVMPAKTHHFAWTKVETIVQLHGIGPWAINYINPADDPRLQKGTSK